MTNYPQIGKLAPNFLTLGVYKKNLVEFVSQIIVVKNMSFLFFIQLILHRFRLLN